MIDSSIYGQLKSPDILGSFQQGLSLADMMNDRKAKRADQEKQMAIKDAYNAGFTQNPDGSVTHDPNKSFEAVAKLGYGQEALALKKQFGDLAVAEQKQKADIENQKLEYTSRAVGAAKANPQAWPQIREDYIAKTGADPSTIPEAYDPKYIAQTENSLLTVAQRQAQGNEDRNYSLREREMALRQRELAASKSDKQSEKEISLMTPYGLANTVDDAKQLKSADEEKKNFDAKIDAMIALREKNKGGAILNREDVARAKQLSKDALLAYKNIAKLGVLSISDEKILNAIIPPDPLAYNSPIEALQGQDATLNNLKSFKKDTDADFNNRLNNRLRGGYKSASTENKTAQETKQINGANYVKVNGGWQLEKTAAK